MGVVMDPFLNRDKARAIEAQTATLNNCRVNGGGDRVFGLIFITGEVAATRMHEVVG